MDARPLASSISFVGRERELAALTHKLGEATRRAGGIALLAGEPGIGKTRLAQQLSEHARSLGTHVLWGRCYEGEGAPSFWPWVQIIRAIAREGEPEFLQAQMGPGAADIARVVPELHIRLPGLPAPPPLEPAQARFRFFDSTSTFLANAAAERPLLLILDDLQWADEPSLLLLQFLSREIRSAPILVLGTYRDLEVRRGHPLARTLAELARLDYSERISLAGLTHADIVRIIETFGAGALPSGLVEVIAKETGGNPFFVTQIVRLLNSEGWLDRASMPPPWNLVIPETVREVLGRRLDRLSERCRRVLTVAALLGSEFRLATLERVSELAGDSLLDAIEEAAAGRVIQPAAGTSGRYSFTHALIREALSEDLGPATRARLHRHIGVALEALYAGDVQPHLAELAHHFTRAAPAGEREKAVDYARRAGDNALALLAYEDAAAHYGRALEALRLSEPVDHTRQIELLLAQADAWNRAGDSLRGRESCLQAVALARTLGSAEALARAALGFGVTHSSKRWLDDERVALLEEALAAMGETETVLRAQLLSRLALELYWSDAHERRQHLSGQAVELARRLGDPETLARALSARHWAIWWPETLAERLTIANELIGLARGLDNHELMLEGLHNRIADLLEAGELEAVHTEFHVYAQLASELRQPRYLTAVAVRAAMLAMFEGRFEEGERLAAEAAALGSQLQEHEQSELFGLLHQLRRVRGDATALLDRYTSTAPWLPPLHGRRVVPLLIACDLGRIEEARAGFERLAAHDFADLPYNGLRLSTAACLAEICACVGDVRRAAILYDLLLPFADRNLITGGIAHICFGSASRPLGLLATVLKRWQDAEAHFDAALQHNACMGARPWVARTQEEYARTFLARRRPGDIHRAIELLEQALSTYWELGMANWAAAAQSGLEQLRAELAPAEPPAYPDGLSAREAEVLRLVASGRSNREIATALVISVSTAAYHLANIMAKTGSANRTEAAAYAHRHSLA